MKKKILGSVVIFAGLLVGSYAGMGYLTQRAIQDTLHDIQVIKGINIAVTQYDRGVFTSKAILTWHVRLPSEHLAPISSDKPLSYRESALPIVLSIAHGPLMLDSAGIHMGLGYAKSTIALPEQYQTQLKAIFNTTTALPTLAISLLIDFLNHAKLALSIPTFRLESPNAPITIKWLGLTGRLNLSLNLGALDGAIQMNGLSIHNANLQVLLGKIMSNYHFEKDAFDLYDGTADFTLPLLQVSRQGKTTFSLNKLFIHSSSETQHDLFSASLNGSLEKMVTNNRTAGPLDVQLSFKNIDAATLSKMNKALRPKGQDSSQAQRKSLLSLLSDLPTLVSKGATFSVSKLSLQLPEGLIAGDLTIALPHAEKANPFQLLSQLQGTGHIRLPVALLTELVSHTIRQKLQENQGQLPDAIPAIQQVEAQATANAPSTGSLESQVQALTTQRIASLIQSGVLVQKENAYSVEIQLKNGSIELNGKPFSPAMLQFG